MNKLRFIRSVIYRLKRDYGSTVDIYYDQTESVDLKTGARNVSTSNLIVKKAIPLPRKVSKNPILAAAVQELFRRGSIVQFSDREIMIDYRDLPDAFSFDRVSYVIFQNVRYEIISFKDYETYAVVVSLKATEGAYRTANVELGVVSNVTATTEGNP